MGLVHVLQGDLALWQDPSEALEKFMRVDISEQIAMLSDDLLELTDGYFCFNMYYITPILTTNSKEYIWDLAPT